MLGVILTIASFMGLLDLFSKSKDRVLPWYGDVIVMAICAIVYVVVNYMFPDHDES